jgi:flagellar biosynthetic protein FliR
MTLVVLALRCVAAVLVLTTLVGGIPRVIQAALAASLGLWCALLLLPSAMIDSAWAPTWALAVQEVAIGCALGIVGAVPLLAAAAAGQLVDIAATGRAQGMYRTFFGVLAAAVFVGVDGHVAVVRAVVESHRSLPMLAASKPAVLGAIAQLLPAAIQLAVPWLVTAAVVQIALGVGSRVGGRAAAHAPTAAAVPAALAMMTAALVATLAVAIASLVRGAL